MNKSTRTKSHSNKTEYIKRIVPRVEVDWIKIQREIGYHKPPICTLLTQQQLTLSDPENPEDFRNNTWEILKKL